MRLDLAVAARRRAISLTPLIDVVFILLLFFMLSSNFMHFRSIDASIAEAASDAHQEVRHLVLEDNLGRFRLGNQILHWDDTVSLSALAREVNTVYAVDTLDGVNTQALVTLLERMKRSGVDKVSLGSALYGAGK